MEKETSRIGIPLTKCVDAAASPSVPEDYTLSGLAACRIRGKSQMPTVSAVRATRGLDATPTAANLSNSHKRGREGVARS